MSVPEPPPASADLTPLRRNSSFQLLWAGGAVSQLGSELTRLAMPLLVLGLTGSPAWAGVVTGAGVAAAVLTQVPAGVWVDRWDRRRTLVTGSALRAANSAGLAVLVTAGGVQVWHLVLFGVVDGMCGAFVDPATWTAIRGVVPVPHLPAAYAQEESRRHAASLLGPPLGGLLYGFGRAVPFVADAVTFLVAALCAVLAKVPRRPAGGRERVRRGMHREAGEAVGWLWRHRGLRSVYGVAMAMNLLGGAMLLPLIVLVGERGGGALDTGAVLATAGLGGLVGALLSRRTGQLLPPGQLFLAVVALFGIALSAMALPLGWWWPMVPLVLIALSTPAINVVMNVVLARLTPDDMLGRMDAVLTVGSRGLAPLGPVLGGALATALGGAASLVLLGALLLLTAAVAATSRDLRGFTGAA
ncbi:MFS transporter [Pseudonocardia aurantiaca]|uniref:MFS transporter n=1 Tax=Pseudonocardia aurantiaca TaxID=75290 RepID=A0ABW4FGG5_9PSEU